MGNGNVDDGAIYNAWLAKTQIEISRGHHGTTGGGWIPGMPGLRKDFIIGMPESRLLQCFP